MCFNEAGHDYGIVPLLLTVISIKESRLTRTAINGSDMDGTEDVCGIQISRSHYKKLSKFNISRNDLFSDPCICIYAGNGLLRILPGLGEKLVQHRNIQNGMKNKTSWNKQQS